MLTIPLLLFIVYILSIYLFDRFRMILATMTMILGLVLLLNDWNNAVVPDDTTKLSFVLSFMMYSLMMIYNIFTEK